QVLFNIFYWIVIIGMLLVLGMIIGGILVHPHTLLDILTTKGGTFSLHSYHSSYEIDINHIQHTRIRTLMINACIIVEVILIGVTIHTHQLKSVTRLNFCSAGLKHS
ncbi:hypothetical protein, partial [Bacillus safensis]|uniref:hypothetical protein n=2 Tax=Bacillus TaxID=1386 RepID=UPI001CDA269D